MRRSILVLILIAALIPQAIAKKWTVDSNPGNNADFATLQAAHDGAADGDTLYVRGSGTSYGILVLTKKLIIFGPGYFLTENPNTQANGTTASTGTITFATGSDGSLFTGFTVKANVVIRISNVIFKRNFVDLEGSGAAGVIVGISASNVTIAQNYIITTTTGNTNASLVLGGSNSIVTNNYIECTSPCRVIGKQTPIVTSSSNIQNNVIFGNVNIVNADFKNNILIAGTYFSPSTTTTNNIGNGTQFDTADGNQENVTMTTVFDGTGSTDGQWQLAVSSPAIGAGIGGIDVGMYGGTDPYVLSGIPHIPNIYQFDGPTTGSTTAGLPITLKVKSNN